MWEHSNVIELLFFEIKCISENKPQRVWVCIMSIILQYQKLRKRSCIYKFSCNIRFEIIVTGIEMLTKLQSYPLVESIKQFIPSIQSIFYIKVSLILMKIATERIALVSDKIIDCKRKFTIPCHSQGQFRIQIPSVLSKVLP